jgi:hypothetical protein
VVDKASVSALIYPRASWALRAQNCYSCCMWQRLRDFRINWKWGVLIGVVLIVVGKFLELSGNEVTVRSGDAAIAYGQFALLSGVIAGVVAGIKTEVRRTAEIRRRSSHRVNPEA